MNKHEKINYLEFPVKDIAATKKFSKAFLTGLLQIMVLIMSLSQTPALMVVFINLI